MIDERISLDSTRWLAASPPPPSVRRTDVRAARRAGIDYPADVLELRQVVHALLPEPSPVRAVGLMLPHGPLRFCGRVAAGALALASSDETAVVLAPNHSGHGPRAVIASHGAWSIPGAVVGIDEQLAEAVRHHAGLAESPTTFDDEHAIEQILPLLIAGRPRLSVVPILLHDVSSAVASRIGAAIADAIVGRGGGATVVATSDLVHYADPGEVESLSRALVDRIAALDDEGLEREIAALGARPGPVLETCGLGALRVAVHALRALGAAPGNLGALGSSNSVEGSRGRCVGYGSIAFTSRT
jgi:AmmeMemoRadiSam system protein B